MAARKGFDRLSPAYRKRLVNAGARGTLSGEPFLSEREVRSYYETGGDLGAGRGHRRPRPAWAAPKDATTRAKVGLLRDVDRKALDKWRRSRRFPGWLPQDPSRFRTDVAAILSELDAPPRRWRDVRVAPKGTGRYWLYIRVSGREHDFVTTLPDWDAVSDLGRLLNDYSRIELGKTKAERAKLEREWATKGGKGLHIAVDIADTDGRSRKAPTPGPLPGPRKGAKPALKRRAA